MTGVPTTAPFHCLILENEAFKAGDVDTGFIVKHADSLQARRGWQACGRRGAARRAARRRCQRAAARRAGGAAGGTAGSSRRPEPPLRLALRLSTKPPPAAPAPQEPPKMKDMSLVSDAAKRGAARRKHATK